MTNATTKGPSPSTDSADAEQEQLAVEREVVPGDVAIEAPALSVEEAEKTPLTGNVGGAPDSGKKDEVGDNDVVNV